MSAVFLLVFGPPTSRLAKLWAENAVQYNRMGSGKGAPEYWVAVVKPGRVMFEIEGVSEAQAKEAMRLAAHKLPIKCKFVVKGQEGGAQ